MFTKLFDNKNQKYHKWCESDNQETRNDPVELI